MANSEILAQYRERSLALYQAGQEVHDAQEAVDATPEGIRAKEALEPVHDAVKGMIEFIDGLDESDAPTAAEQHEVLVAIVDEFPELHDVTEPLLAKMEQFHSMLGFELDGDEAPVDPSNN